MRTGARGSVRRAPQKREVWFLEQSRDCRNGTQAIAPHQEAERELGGLSLHSALVDRLSGAQRMADGVLHLSVLYGLWPLSGSQLGRAAELHQHLYG